ncbi:MAG: alpha/beta hydrolase [Actinobacteria bacterium]|nr:alpha/beta hydrolase [Actinomycetota bacterium]
MAPDRSVAGELACREWGEAAAPVLVFLHGLGVIGPNATDEPAEAWAARGFRVLAPDLPGFGDTPAVTREEYLPSRLARRLLGELPETFSLVGFSWGATIGCHIVALAPERVRALVLVDAGYQSPAGPPSYDELLASAREELGGSRFPDAAAFLKLVRGHYSPRLSDAALLATLREENGELVPRVSPEVYAAGLHGFHTEPTPPLYGALRGSQTPILLLVAGRSANERQQADLVAFRAALPDADVHLYPDSGHNVLLDAADEAIPAVADWLARRQPRAA